WRESRPDILRKRCVGRVQPRLHFDWRSTRRWIFIVRISDRSCPGREQNCLGLKLICFCFEKARVVTKICRPEQRFSALTLENQKVWMPLAQQRKRLPASPVIVKRRTAGRDRTNIDNDVER